LIGYLRGKVAENNDGKLVVLIGDESAVGYAISAALRPGSVACLPGETVALYIHTHVREDALDLFGFLSREEKELFLTLLSVNGIGPKAALSILSNIEPARLIEAIIEGRKSDLTDLPGVGKKLAERLALELKDKLQKKLAAGVFGSRSQPSLGAAVAQASAARDASDPERAIVADARAALLGLGYRETQISNAIDDCLRGLSPLPARAEELVRLALKTMKG